MKGFIGKAHKLFNADLVEPPQPSPEKRKSKPPSTSNQSTLAARESLAGSSSMPSELNLQSNIQDPSALDILRYRYHHATNLGSVYVLERWLSPSRFPQDVTGSSELEAVKAWFAKIGADQTKELFEEAWEVALLDEYVLINHTCMAEPSV